jgi:hypothetical protein
MKDLRQFWHGDLLLQEVKSIPKRCKKVDTDILAEGESTHHAHQLTGGQFSVFMEPRPSYIRTDVPETLFVQVKKPTTLVHIDLLTKEKADHDPVILPVGLFELIRQEEEDPLNRRSRLVYD